MAEQSVPPNHPGLSNAEAVCGVPPLGPSAGGAEGVLPLEGGVTSPIWRSPQASLEEELCPD